MSVAPMLTVASVLRSGGIYTPHWVERLQAGVKRHLQTSHQFVCVSDVDVPCERVPLRHDWPGWWSKMEVFRLPGPVLYIDLDSAIVGDLSQIAVHAIGTPGLTGLRDFYAPQHFGSGVMTWNGDIRHLYDRFSADADGLMNVSRKRMGDQALIEDMVGAEDITFLQDCLPGQAVSYKCDCEAGPCPVTGRYRRGGIPEGARIICLHGEPKFSGMPANDPVRTAWELAA